MAKVSVIVPVYNAQDSIRRTMENLCAQTLKDIEIIIVDDGSNDLSKEVCREFEKNNTNVSYFYQENAGPGAARNTGLCHATGEYVGFCDADDTVDVRMYEYLYRYAKESNSDFAACGAYDEKEQQKLGFHWPNKTVLEQETIWQEMVPVILGGEEESEDLEVVKGSAVRCVFRREWLTEHDIRFPSEFWIDEDVIFLLRALTKARRGIICDRIFYRYNSNPQGLRNCEASYDAELFAKRKIFLHMIRELLLEMQNFEHNKKRFDVLARANVKECIKHAYQKSSDKKAARLKCKEIMQDQLSQKAFCEISNRNALNLMPYLLLKYRCNGLLSIYYRE